MSRSRIGSLSLYIISALFCAQVFTGCGNSPSANSTTTAPAAAVGTSPATAVKGDPVVVNAEKTAAIAKDTFDEFLKLEYEHRELLLKNAPQIHAFAQTLRHRANPGDPPNAIKWIQTLRRVTLAYKYNRSAENKANVSTALETVAEALSQANQYIAQANAATP